MATDRGQLVFGELFRSAQRFEHTADAEIAYPGEIRAIAGSGSLRTIRAVFKHQYQGELIVINPLYLDPICCTPEHRVYATDSIAKDPTPIEAQFLTKSHYLIIPYHVKGTSTELDTMIRTAGESDNSTENAIVETKDYILVPVRDISLMEYSGDVYNMEVEEEHNYLARFFLVSNCQNWITSQALRDTRAGAAPIPATPQELVALAKAQGAKFVVSSYNEPLITAEWAVAVFKEAKAHGVTGFVSNGNATRAVLDYIRPWT